MLLHCDLYTHCLRYQSQTDLDMGIAGFFWAVHNQAMPFDLRSYGFVHRLEVEGIRTRFFTFFLLVVNCPMAVSFVAVILLTSVNARFVLMMIVVIGTELLRTTKKIRERASCCSNPKQQLFESKNGSMLSKYDVYCALFARASQYQGRVGEDRSSSCLDEGWCICGYYRALQQILLVDPALRDCKSLWS